MKLLLGEGRKDESDDFTEGAGLSISAIGEIIRIFKANAHNNMIERLLGLYKEKELLSKILGEDFNLDDEIDKDTDEVWGEAEYDEFQQLPVNLREYSSEEQDVISRDVVLWTLVASRFNVNSKFKEGVRDLIRAACQFSVCDYSRKRILIDPSVVRGLEYYTGMVYEAELLFDVTNEKLSLIHI